MPKKKSVPKEEGYVFPTDGAKFAGEEVEKAFEGKTVSFDAHDVTKKIIEFGKALTGMELYPYQLEAAYAIIYSVITFSGDVKTMLFSRQSGKTETVAFVVDTLCVLLPSLAKFIPDLEQFKDGFRVGLFAPQADQVATTYSRAMTRINSANAEMVMSDPDIDIELESSVRLELTNGSYLAGQCAAKQSKIESKTYDLVIVEEAQDVDDLIVSKCYAEDTLINMPYGDYITIKECVQRKTSVMTPEGKIKPTDWLDTGKQEVFRVELCNGRHLDVTGLHRNLAVRRGYNGRKPFECLTKDLRVGDRLAVRDVLPTFGHYGDYSMGLVLGLLLGDGNFSSNEVNFCGFDEVWEYVAPHVEKLGCKAFRRTYNPKNGLYEGSFITPTHDNSQENKIKRWLSDLGLWGRTGFNKFIPNLPYSKEFLEGLICGLFEADGSVQALKKGNIRYASISKKLVEGLSLQLQKFGVHCSISIKDQEGGFGETSNRLYELHIRDRISVIRFVDSFRLITKNDKLDRAKKIAESLNTDAGCTKVFEDGNRYVRIKSIKSIGVKQTYCVTVPTEDHWIIANGIVSGNSIEPMVSACVCAGTMVWNNKGDLVPIEQLHKSDGIIGYNGKGFSKETISYFQEPTDKECYRITTHTGRTLECSYDHPILFRERKGGAYGRKMLFKETQDLQVGNQIAVLEELPLFGTKTMWEPRLVGWLIGDGSYGIDKTPRLSCCDKEIYSYVKSRFAYAHDISPRLTFDNRLYQELRIKGITKELREIGIYGQTCEKKRLPKDFHSYDMWSMSEVLGGFFDTDGHVTSDGKRRGSICLSSCVWKLLDEVRLALQKFGIHCTIVCKHPSKSMFGRKDYYVLTVSDKRSVENFYNYISFKVSYKQRKLTELIGLYSAHKCKIPSETKGLRFERVVSIEHIGVKPVYNLTADVTHTYVANGIVTHNTGGSIIKVGTTGMFKNHFWYEIQHNRAVDRKITDIRCRNHFEYDYKRIIKDRREQYDKDHKRFHLNYENDVMRKKERWGEDSQAFKLAYALIWDLESGMLITDKEFIGICNKKLGMQLPGLTDYVVAGMDIGKAPAETVLTIAKVIRDPDDIFAKPYKQILAWIALGGMDYEAQHHVIMDSIVEYNVQTLYGDYTGVGRAVLDRLMYACGEYVNIVPYTFSAQSKSDMWYNFTAEISSRRLIVPANKVVRGTPEFMKFEEQMKNCQKYFDGPYLKCEKSEGYFDDFVDSCALMCLAANEEQTVEEEMEVMDNPLYGSVTSEMSSIRRNSY